MIKNNPSIRIPNFVSVYIEADVNKSVLEEQVSIGMYSLVVIKTYRNIHNRISKNHHLITACIKHTLS